MKNKFHVALVSNNAGKLESFYEKLLGKKPSFRDSDDYLEFDLEADPILDIESLDLLDSGWLDARNHNFYLRFEVEDIDLTYRQCKKDKIKILNGPVTQPYGKRELYILDPVGNLIQLFQEIQ